MVDSNKAEVLPYDDCDGSNSSMVDSNMRQEFYSIQGIGVQIPLWSIVTFQISF